MRRVSQAFALAIGWCATGCGDRTGLLLTQTSEDGSTSWIWGSPGPVYCSSLLGPISSCLETPETGSVVACPEDFPRCINPEGFEPARWGCCSGTGPINGPGGSCFGQGRPCPLYRSEIDVDIQAASTTGTVYACLPTTLPTNGYTPNCVVVAARYPEGTGSSAEIDDCTRCDTPGLLLPDAFLEPSVSSALSGYECLCRIEGASCGIAGLPRGSGPWWCYSDASGDTACSVASISITSSASLGADLYIACFGGG